MGEEKAPRFVSTNALRSGDSVAIKPAPPRASVFQRIRSEFRRSNKWAYVFIAPLVIDFAIFTVYMVYKMFTMSFQDIAYGRVEWIGLDHYDWILNDTQFWNALENTAVFATAVVVGGLLLALILSEFIYRRSTAIQIFYKSALYLPAVVSTVVLSIVWSWIYQPFHGILNYAVGLFGVEPMNWLGDPELAMPSIILMTIVGGIGVNIVFITASMGSIPTEIYDAARIDGAGEWTRFWRVTVPLLRPTLLYLSVVGFISAFQVFEQIYVMTQGGPGYPGATETIGYLIYSSAFNAFNLGQAAAQSVILFFVIVIFSIVQFRIFASEVRY